MTYFQDIFLEIYFIIQKFYNSYILTPITTKMKILYNNKLYI